MKKVLLFLLFGAMLSGAAVPNSITSSRFLKQPQNVKCLKESVYVSANTVDTMAFTVSGNAWKIGVVGIYDTNIVDQDSLNIGDGVKIRQLIGMHPGNINGWAAVDTHWTIVGDTAGIQFDNSVGLSSDSLICATMDTASMSLKAWGKVRADGAASDSMWISNGYFVPVTDPAPILGYEVTGSATLGATVKKILVYLWVFNNIPADNGER